MLRAVCRDKTTGEPHRYLGINARNLELIQGGSPLRCDGKHFGLPDRVILIVYQPPGTGESQAYFAAYMNALYALTPSSQHDELRAFFPVSSDQMGIVFILDDVGVERLVSGMAWVLGLKDYGIDGDFTVIYRETNEELAKFFGIVLEGETPRGYVDVFEPITGRMVRVKTEKSDNAS